MPSMQELRLEYASNLLRLREGSLRDIWYKANLFASTPFTYQRLCRISQNYGRLNDDGLRAICLACGQKDYEERFAEFVKERIELSYN